jgi:hypothetical protein
MLFLAAHLALLLLGPADAKDYVDDSCPDQGGTAFVVDSAEKAFTVANGYNLPSCHLIIRADVGGTQATTGTLRIVARSVTIDAPVTVRNPFVDSRVVISAHEGDILVSSGQIAARKDVWLECRAPDTCTVTVQKNAVLKAGRAVRTMARGAVRIQDAAVSGGEIAVDAKPSS